MSSFNARVLIAAAAVTLLVGCTSSKHAHSTSTPVTSANPAGSSATSTGAPSTSATSASSADRAGLAARVEAVGLQASDLHPGELRQLIDGGDQVVGQVTLDNCGFDFTSEAYRLVRRQYQITPSAGDSVISTEVVAYDTAAHAQLALEQWYAAAAHCPKTQVSSGVAGMPALTYTILDNRRDVAMLPVHPNVVTSETAASANQGTEHAMTIMQQHGQILAMVYLDTPNPWTQAQRDEAVALAGKVGARLSRQP